MSTRSLSYVFIAATLGMLVLSSPAAVVHAQPLAKKLFDDTSDNTPGRRNIPNHRARRTHAHLAALNGADVVVNLFDDVQLTVHKTKVEKYLTDHYVWHGRTADGDVVTLALVRGVMTGLVYGHGRSFEIAPDANGSYTVSDLDAAAFPTDDPTGLALEPVVMAAGDSPAVTGAGDTSGSSSTTAAGDTSTGTIIDAMVVWTPAARNAVGGSVDAIQSLVLSAVANANQAYVNSGVNAQLRLVYSGEVNYTESAIQTDLSALATNGDGILDNVQTLRAQYGADVVTMIGNGYAAAGSCGYGYIMSTTSTSFAPYAFNVVDQSCAAGYLSYAHEVGHNEGLQHDPANAGSSPSFPYAYGYQDPGGQFRTVLSYGGETRIPYFSSPLVTYNGVPTGVSGQDNARALTNNVATVAAFMPTAGSAPPPPTPVPQPCTYSLSATSLTFSSSSGAVAVTVSTGSGCGWTTASGASWVAVTPGTASGAGTANVSVVSNAGALRTTTITIAGQAVTVTQKAPVVKKGKGH